VDNVLRGAQVYVEGVVTAEIHFQKYSLAVYHLYTVVYKQNNRQSEEKNALS